MTLPQPSQSFVWTQEPWGMALRCVPLLDLAPHLFTSRSVSVSRDPRDPALGAVAASIGLTPDAIVQVQQVHGRTVVRVERGEAPLPDAWADAIISNDPRCGVAVRVADCAPILIADRSRRAVGAVHAGWRGTAANVVAAAVDAMAAAYDCERTGLVVAMGPLIRACCYEVGPSTRDVFVEQGHGAAVERWFSPGRGDRLQLDVAAANRDQLLAAGVSSPNIHDSGLCTRCHAEALHSFRKDGAAAGRMLGLIRATRNLHLSTRRET